MTTTITKEIVQQEFTKAMVHVSKIIPMEKWLYAPQTVVGYLTCNRSNSTMFGRARSNGLIEINEAYFIGSTELEALRSTLIHEFTHLIHGMNHNPRFKRIEEWLHDGYCTLANRNVNMDRVKKSKFTIFAIMTDGSEIEIQQANKPHKKYTKYDKAVRPLNVCGKLIESFEYKLNYEK